MSSTNYFAPPDDSGLTKHSEIMEKIISISIKNQVTLDGLMTIGMLETGLRTLDFECCEDVAAEPFKGNFRVQGMRDGNVYMTEQPKRIRNKAIFRDDNASLTKGRDGKYYFCFSLDEDQLEQLPEKLVRQASAIAQKVLKEIIYNK